VHIFVVIEAIAVISVGILIGGWLWTGGRIVPYNEYVKEGATWIKKRNHSFGLLRAALLVMVVLSLLALWRVWHVMKMLAIVTYQLNWVLTLVGIGCVALVMAMFLC